MDEVESIAFQHETTVVDGQRPIGLYLVGEQPRDFLAVGIAESRLEKLPELLAHMILCGANVAHSDVRVCDAKSDQIVRARVFASNLRGPFFRIGDDSQLGEYRVDGFWQRRRFHRTDVLDRVLGLVDVRREEQHRGHAELDRKELGAPSGIERWNRANRFTRTLGNRVCTNV